MDERGVLLIPEIISGLIHEKSQIGGKMHVTELKMKMTWVDAENPQETIPCEWYAQGTDQHEKGVGKALTYAEKFFILKFFNIATDQDDPDSFEAKISGEKPPKQADTKPASNKSPDTPDGEMSAAQWKFIEKCGKDEGLSKEETIELVKWVAGTLNVPPRHWKVAKSLLPLEAFQEQIEKYNEHRQIDTSKDDIGY